MKFVKFIPVLTILLCLGACSSADETEKTNGYEFTGKDKMNLVPMQTDIPYGLIVTISDPSLHVSADIDLQNTDEVQKVPFEIVDENGNVIDSKEVSVWVRPTGDLSVEASFPQEAVSAADFNPANYIQASYQLEDEGESYTLSPVSGSTLVSGEAGYTIYDAESGKMLTGGVWTAGDYRIVIVASNGYGNTLAKGDFQFELTD